MTRKLIGIGFLMTFALLALHLLIMDSYGLTWDFHHHFFSGLYMLKRPLTADLTNLPFTEPDPRTSIQLPYGPIMTVTPVISYIMFFEKLGILAFDNAYNLPIILIGVIGIFVLFLFLLEATDPITAIAATLILALYPRYFGDLHNNMKDIPQAVTFTFSIWMFWRFVQFRRIKDMLFAALSFAIAFNTKVNALFIIPIVTIWILFLFVTRSLKQLEKPLKKITSKEIILVFSLFLIACFLSLSIWWPFWDNPLERLQYLPQFFATTTSNVESLFFGNWYCSGRNIPWYYPFGYLSVVTPLPVLILFGIGGIVILIRIIRHNPTASLFLLWFILPLTRYLDPKTGVMDGIRHFLEVVYPLSVIAGIGAKTLIIGIINVKPKKISKIIALSVSFITIGYLIYTIIIYHPNQISYFNELVGGINGAYGKFDVEYWGTSQKEAINWVNKNAPENAVVYIAMMQDIGTKYLRPDLRNMVNSLDWDTARYVVVLNRLSFFYRYGFLFEYILHHKPAYTVQNQGVPLVWVFDNDLGVTPRQTPWWHGDSPCIYRYWSTPLPP